MIKRLSRERFNLFILGTRTLGQEEYVEISFWSNLDETIIGFVAQNKIDHDYAYGILMRNEIKRFNFCAGETSLKREDIARKNLNKEIKNLTRSYESRDAIFIQEKESKSVKSINLLEVSKETSDDKLHPSFKILIESPVFIPARKVIEELSPWISPVDTNLVEQFQGMGFDQRIWELYLWAALKNLLFDVTHLEAPDFLCGFGKKKLFAIEATTVAPSTSGILLNIPDVPQDLESVIKYNDDYMSMKFGSSLTNKLNKMSNGQSYWEQPETKKLPFILAIADFHRPDNKKFTPSMGYTHSGLPHYLYGLKPLVVGDKEGNYHSNPTFIEKHQYLSKEIPSGFFNLPKSENISAILFCNAGTISKFNRMGILAGFGNPNIQHIRIGEKYNTRDPLATEGVPCKIDIRSPGYHENWSDELTLFHNSKALYPLDKNIFKDINQHFLVGDHIESLVYPTWIYSVTCNLFPYDIE